MEATAVALSEGESLSSKETWQLNTGCQGRGLLLQACALGFREVGPRIWAGETVKSVKMLVQGLRANTNGASGYHFKPSQSLRIGMKTEGTVVLVKHNFVAIILPSYFHSPRLDKANDE
ncbi:unnamed protein product [Dovyalis caffra]|uniref:Uncharacterized protein n=1 Tax=Dovyalis caffra TaxID=77055 RepID=A0AAV1R0M2_9ROSI|nr:unnamed protein product [Dovyalis caffra]